MKILIFFLTSICIFGCKKENKDEQIFNFKKGFFIVNEGNFTYGNSSISFYDFFKKEVINNIFYKANKIPLGDVAMDLKIYDGKCFITINNSGCIYIVDPSTFKLKSTIKNLTSPRYMVKINDSIMYVTDLYNPSIYLINIKKLKIENTIFIGKSTESLVKKNNFVFITSWSFNDKVYIIDIEKQKLIDSIKVGLQPCNIVIDKNEDLWVLCDGGYEGNPIGYENPSLYKINGKNLTIEKIIKLKRTKFQASSLIIDPNGENLYFINEHIYKLSIYDTIPNLFIVNHEKNFYSLAISPNNDFLIVCDAKNFLNFGTIFIYTINGNLIEKHNVGIIPRTITFLGF